MKDINTRQKEYINSKKAGTELCRFFLDNKCKNGEGCNFSHDKSKGNRHITECKFFEHGYCKNGINCQNAHIQRNLCINYLLGFCPEGKYCKNYHLKSLISKDQDNFDCLVKNKDKMG